MPLNNSLPISEWSDHSFFIELKPRSDQCSLFIDCPREGVHPEAISTHNGDLVKIGRKGIVVNSLDEGIQWGAHLEDLVMQPESMCSPAWADGSRLFMCKVHAHAFGRVLPPKTYPRLCRDMSPSVSLSTFSDLSPDSTVDVICQCGAVFVHGDKGTLSVGTLPSDDWLSTSPGIDFYCRDSCGPACDPNRHGHKHESVDQKPANCEWIPTGGKILISNSFIHIDSKSINNASICIDERNLLCSACKQQIGITCRVNPVIWQLHHGVVTLKIGKLGFLENRFPFLSQFLSTVILNSCESQSSQKIVIRDLDKTPHLLVWLLDSYVVMTAGKLEMIDSGEDGERREDRGAKPFPALKMLYKIFDENTAASDPRANGEDASVGLLELPSSVTMQIMEMLLRSTHSMPPACRSVGQFYVGYMQLDHCIFQ